MKSFPFRPPLFASLIMTIVGTFSQYSAMGAMITVSPGDNTSLDGTIDHSQDNVVMSGGNLHLTNGTKLGGSGASLPGVDMTGGNLTMDGGTSMSGSLNLDNRAAADVGKIGTGSAVLYNVLALGQSSVALDNVQVTSNDYHAIDLAGQSHMSATAQTHVIGGAEWIGVLLKEQATASFDGSAISAGLIGISANDQSATTLSGSTVAAAGGGVQVADGANVTISGGSLTTTNTRGAGNGAGMLLDFDAFGAEVIGVSSASGSPSLTLSNTTIKVNRGLANTGLGMIADDGAHPVITANNSVIHADGYGAVFDQNPGGTNPGTGVSTLNLNNTTLQADNQDAIWVQQNSQAVINLVGQNTKLLAGAGKDVLRSDAGSTTTMTVDGSNVTGNVVNNGGATHISLVNQGSWSGSMQGTTDIALASGTNWNMAGSSVITQAMDNAGTVTLSDSGSTTRNTLTVGNYTSNDGTLVFNSLLAGDDSPTDKLHIQGDSNGTSNVVVTNLGGQGAQTQNGIPLIHVDGTANGDFQKKGRIVAGAYEYNLLHSADKKDWFLASELIQPDNFTYNSDSPIPLYRPEAGSYIANQAAANTMFITRLRDRQGETRYIDPVTGQAGVTTLWLRQVGSHNGFHSGPENQLKTQSNTYVAQLGGELANGSTDGHDSWHLGVMGGYGQNHSDTIATTTKYQAKGTVTGYSVGAYATWLANDADRTGPYVDTWLQYGWFDNKVDGDQLSGESYKSSGFTASMETGYTFNIGHSGGGENPTYYYIEPNIQAIWMDVRRNDHRESNGTETSGADEGNLQSRVGTRFFINGHNKIDNGKNRSFQPFVEVNWIHNTRQFAVNMDGVNISQNGATDIGELKLGVEGQISKAVQLWGNVGQQMGDKGYNNTTAILGIKYSFR